ncbi:hypothetical protein G7Y89_g7668 [Cudoniella acicularis]|uniref:Uncharacterized protein n=1 Tax=Cudoniella acicularis TaxID=354080 RepID=A0A8H4W1C0_9HELO|nr:hypothetical protein G7Y89_g7668 [Cudoniella acicularis]
MASYSVQIPKSVEAGQERSQENSEAVPSYADHTADDLVPEIIPNYGSGLPNFEDAPESSTYESITVERASQTPQPLPPTVDGPLSLTLDKSLIFPNTVPATALYSLNYTLNSMGNSIMLRRSVPGPTRLNGRPGKIVDKELYSIERRPMDQVTQIHGQRKSTFPGIGGLEIKKGLFGKHWECRFKNKIVLRGKSGIWEDGDKRIVAREVNEVPIRSKKGKENEVDSGIKDNPGLNIEAGVDDLLVDLMVAVWCAKIWFLAARAARSGENYFGGRAHNMT